MVTKKCTKYIITAKENYGKRRVIHFFNKKSEANNKLKQILSPPKSRIVHGKKIYLTSYRDAQSGTGINNPRIKKIRSVC